MKTTKKSLLLMLLGTFVFPLLFILILALAVSWRFPQLIPDRLSLVALFSTGDNLLKGLSNSLIIAVAVSVLCVPAAFAISKQLVKYRNKQMVLLCAYLPFTISPVVYAACLNYYFVVAGLNGTLVGVISAQLIIVFPYNIILFMSHWNKQLESYAELVSTLGGNKRQTYFKVLIPLSRKIIVIAFFQSFLISWFEFGLTNFIGIGQVQTLTVRVYQYIGEANVQFSAVSSLILILPPLFLLWLNKKTVFHQV